MPCSDACLLHMSVFTTSVPSLHRMPITVNVVAETCARDGRVGGREAHRTSLRRYREQQLCSRAGWVRQQSRGRGRRGKARSLKVLSRSGLWVVCARSPIRHVPSAMRPCHTCQRSLPPWPSRVDSRATARRLPTSSNTVRKGHARLRPGEVQGWRACPHVPPGCPTRGVPAAASRQLYLLSSRVSQADGRTSLRRRKPLYDMATPHTHDASSATTDVDERAKCSWLDESIRSPAMTS